MVCGTRDIRHVARRCASPPGDQIRGTAQIDCQHEPLTLGVDIQPRKRRPGKVARPVSASPLMLDMSVMCRGFILGCSASGHRGQCYGCCQYEHAVRCASGSSGASCRGHSSLFRCSECLPRRPRPRCRGDQRRIRRHPFRSTVFRWDIHRKFRARIVRSVFHRFHRESSFGLHEGAHRLRLERPCC